MILAWIGAALIGLSLGLLGSGGSILTVPVLVYLVGENSTVAITESLAIVGCISLFGAIPYALERKIAWRSLWLFGLPGIVGTYLGSVLSQHLAQGVQLTLFAAIMLLSAMFMFSPLVHKSAAPTTGIQITNNRVTQRTVLQGFLVGVVTGVVGVGGGFLIVPALVLLGGLPMPYAVGTSLSIITLNSFTGFFKHLHLHDGLHWLLIAAFAVIGILGSFAGSRLSKRVPAAALRKGFAAFLVLMGLYVLFTNLPKM